METRINLSPASLKLAYKTLQHSSITAPHVILAGTGLDDIDGVPMIYFDFRYRSQETRVYADTE